jgi:predicted AAA+ superfamily ATPase
MQDRTTMVRETSALELARQNLHVDDCTVVTWDDEADLDSGVKVVPVWKWLLQENSR